MIYLKDYPRFINEALSLDQTIAQRVQTGISSEFININQNLKPVLDNVKKGGNIDIDVNRTLAKIQNWMVTSIPAEIPKMKSGVGGADWASRLVLALKSIVAEEANAALTGPVKTLIKGYFFFGGKEGFVKDTVALASKPIEGAGYSPLKQYYKNLYAILVKISLSARYKNLGDSSELAEILPYSKAIRKWEYDALTYLDKNQTSIFTGIVSTVSDSVWK